MYDVRIVILSWSVVDAAEVLDLEFLLVVDFEVGVVRHVYFAAVLFQGFFLLLVVEFLLAAADLLHHLCALTDAVDHREEDAHQQYEPGDGDADDEADVGG